MLMRTAEPPRAAPVAAAALAIAAVGAATILGAYFFEYVLHYQPCPLCLEQRIPYYVAIPLALVVAVAAKRQAPRPLLISVVSFGFRYGIPSDADLVFDVRFLPNPHFVPRLRPYSGKDPKVARYIRSFPQTGQFLRRIENLLAYLLPHYIREGKSYLTIALGCTGGRHRSVTLAEVISRNLKRRGYATKVVHRDMDKSGS